jgi:hypothetical protein
MPHRQREHWDALIIDLLRKLTPFLPKLVALPNVHLAPTPSRPTKGNVSDLVTSVFEIYFYHSPLMEKSLRAEASLYVAEYQVDVYDNFWPFLDPGCGDSVDITNRAVDDLAHLPNLKTITGLNVLNPGRKLIRELEKREIEVIVTEI